MQASGSLVVEASRCHGMLFSLFICIQTQHLGLLTFGNPQKVFMWKGCSHLPRWSGLSAVMEYLTKAVFLSYQEDFLLLWIQLFISLLSWPSVFRCSRSCWFYVFYLSGSFLFFPPCQIDSLLPATSIFWRNRGDGCNLWQPVLDKNCYNLFIFFNVLACWHPLLVFLSSSGFSLFRDLFFCVILVYYCVILCLLVDVLCINQRNLYYLGIHYVCCNREHDFTTAATLKVIVCDDAFYLIPKIECVGEWTFLAIKLERKEVEIVQEENKVRE